MSRRHYPVDPALSGGSSQPPYGPGFPGQGPPGGDVFVFFCCVILSDILSRTCAVLCRPSPGLASLLVEFVRL